MIILINLMLTSAFGQKNAIDKCFIDNNPKTKITRQTYPFNKAERILLVTGDQGRPNIFSADSVPWRIIPKKPDLIDTIKFLAKHQLTNNGIDSLLKIINQGSKGNVMIEPFCTEPSNAILFIDEEGNIFEYIAICFGSFGKDIEYSEVANSWEINLGSWCKNKGAMLRNFFQRRGLETVLINFE